MWLVAAIAAAGLAIASVTAAAAHGNDRPAATRGDSSSSCQTAVDCELNGECVRSRCVCDKGWTGAQCGALNLDPVAHVAYGYNPLTPLASRFSSWGGGPPVKSAEDGKYHLFVSELAGQCGMSTWNRMSTASHAISDRVEGPYTKVETLIGTESSNAICKDLDEAPDRSQPAPP